MAQQTMDRLPEERRKRVNRLKKIIIGTVISAIVIPIFICICLGIRLHSVKKQLAVANATISELQGEAQDEVAVDETLEVELVDENIDGTTATSGYEINSDTTLTGTGNENSNSSKDAETSDGIKHVYLTFDDGPSNNTEEILDILKKYNVKATFFVVGNTSDHGRELLKRIVDEGHSIGVHSYSHKYSSIYATEDAFFDDYAKMSDYIYEVTGVHPKICRLPGGSSNTVSDISMANVVRKLNESEVTCYDWNISGGDATGQNLSADTIATNVLSGVDRFHTSMVLLHDGADKDETVKALTKILDDLTEREDVVIEQITDKTPVILHIAL